MNFEELIGGPWIQLEAHLYVKVGKNGVPPKDYFILAENYYVEIELKDYEIADLWRVKFWHKFKFLNNIHEGFVIGSCIEVKRQIDEFIIKINKLKMFV